MPAVATDHSQPLAFTVTFRSPDVVVYRLWYKKPGEEKFTIFATGTDNEPSSVSQHTHTVDALPAGSEIVYLVWFSGNPNNPYSLIIDLHQGGLPAPGGSLTLKGTLDESGFAQEKDTITLP